MSSERMSKRNSKTPYQRIMIAFRKGVGVCLSPKEVRAMAVDTAIEHLAMNDDQKEAGDD
jgi:hypothetical protein